jgi:hypothetical protein
VPHHLRFFFKKTEKQSGQEAGEGSFLGHTMSVIGGNCEVSALREFCAV